MKLENREKALYSLRGLYESFGYRRFRMSRFEEYELYVRNKDFLISDRVITFTDHSGRLLAMKPDVTLSIIKHAADGPGQIQKVYYNENVYRAAGSDHSFKEILQAGLECVGDLGSYEIAEVVLLAVKSLEAVSPEFMLDISHMGLVGAVLEESGLSPSGKKLALGCLHQKNCHELARLCDEEGVDGSVLLALADFCGGSRELETLAGLLQTENQRHALSELMGLCEILEKRGYGSRIQVDFSAANDLKYYSGVVFKGYLPGIPTGVLSGGQYDKLLQKMGRSSRAIGFAIYMDLLEEPREQEAVDTLILAGSAGEEELLAAAEKYAARGSVLVCRQLPENRVWKNLVELGKGEVE